MTSIVIRVTIVLLLLAGGIYALEQILAENQIWAAIRQVFVSAWHAMRGAFIKAASLVSKSGAAWLKRTAGKTVARQVVRSTVAVLMAWFLRLLVRRYGKQPVLLRLAWARLRRRKFARTLKRALAYRLPLPKILNATIGLCCILGVLWLIVFLNRHYSIAEMLVASTLLFWALEKIPVFGCEALFSFLKERWAPLRDSWRYLCTYQPRAARLISWLWLQPAIDWLLSGVRDAAHALHITAEEKPREEEAPSKVSEEERPHTRRIPFSH